MAAIVHWVAVVHIVRGIVFHRTNLVVEEFAAKKKRMMMLDHSCLEEETFLLYPAVEDPVEFDVVLHFEEEFLVSVVVDLGQVVFEVVVILVDLLEEQEPLLVLMEAYLGFEDGVQQDSEQNFPGMLVLVL